jgi:hypothetical protein
MHEAVQPLKEVLEPYKVHEETRERGKPHIHEPYSKLSIRVYHLSRLRETPRGPLVQA